VKQFLARQGYQVKGEIHHCDMVAVREGAPPMLVVVELKLGLTLELVLQAVDRMAACDAVWIAVPRTRRGRDRDRRSHKLCRLLGLGLLAVNPRRGSVEVLVEPAPYRPRRNLRRRVRLLDEHGRRRGDPSPGGSTRTPIMTAYRQAALVCAAALRDGSRRPRDLTPLAPAAGRILLHNVYGWFERTGRGVYRLSRAGEAALQRWAA